MRYSKLYGVSAVRRKRDVVAVSIIRRRAAPLVWRQPSATIE